jgi:predicted O-methyltransferase YrrM
MRSTAEGAEQGDGWSTLRISEWLEQDRSRGHLYCVDIDQSHLDLAVNVLRDKHLLNGCQTFMRQDSVDYLNVMEHIDFAFLDTSDDLEHGLAEFKAVEYKGAKVIVMDDIPTKAVLAIAYAVDKGWKVRLEGRLAVMRR